MTPQQLQFQIQQTQQEIDWMTSSGFAKSFPKPFAKQQSYLKQLQSDLANSTSTAVNPTPARPSPVVTQLPSGGTLTYNPTPGPSQYTYDINGVSYYPYTGKDITYQPGAGENIQLQAPTLPSGQQLYVGSDGKTYLTAAQGSTTPTIGQLSSLSFDPTVTQQFGTNEFYTPAMQYSNGLKPYQSGYSSLNRPATISFGGQDYTQLNSPITFPNGGVFDPKAQPGQTTWIRSDGKSVLNIDTTGKSSQPITVIDPIPQLLGQPNQAFNTIYQGSQDGSLSVKNVNGVYTLTDKSGNPVQTGEYISVSPVEGKPGVYQVGFANPASEGSVTGYIATDPNTGVLAPISYDNATKQFAYQPGSPGGFLTNFLSAVAPILPIVGALAGGGIGGAVADALGISELLAGTVAESLAPQIGSAIVNVAQQVAQGTPIEKAVQNAAVSSLVQTGSSQVAQALNTVIQNPTVSNAIGSAVSSAAKASLSGGNSDTALTSALLGAGTSLVTSDSTSTKTPQEPSTTVQPGETTGPLAGPTGSIGTLADQTPATGGGLTTEAAAGTPPKTTAEATPAPVPTPAPVQVAAAPTGTSSDVTAGTTGVLPTSTANLSLPPGVPTGFEKSTVLSGVDGTPVYVGSDSNVMYDAAGTKYTFSPSQNEFVSPSGQLLKTQSNLGITTGSNQTPTGPTATGTSTGTESGSPAAITSTPNPLTDALVAAITTPGTTTGALSTPTAAVPELPPVSVAAPATTPTSNVAANTTVSTSLAQGLGTNLGVNPATPSLPPISVTAPSEPTANVSTVTISPSTGNVPQLEPVVATLPQQTPGAPGNVTTVTVPQLEPIVATLPSTPQLEPISVTAKPDANVSTVTISAGEGNAATSNATSNTSTYKPEITTITSARQGQNLFEPSTTYAPTQTGVSPGSAALAQALNVGDVSAPLFDKTGKKPRNVWNQASLRVKDETGT